MELLLLFIIDGEISCVSKFVHNISLHHVNRKQTITNI